MFDYGWVREVVAGGGEGWVGGRAGGTQSRGRRGSKTRKIDLFSRLYLRVMNSAMVLAPNRYCTYMSSYTHVQHDKSIRKWQIPPHH